MRLLRDRFAAQKGGPVVKGFVHNLEVMTEKNGNFRQVLYTGKHIQLVLMSLRPGEDIGEEVHTDVDQFFRVEKGKAEVRIDDRKVRVEAGDAIVVPAGARHNITNIGEKALKLYTLYGPPTHEDHIVQVTKSEAESSKEHFAGYTTE